MNKADIIIYNPPFESEDKEKDRSLESWWGGGKNGGEILTKSLPHIVNAMRKNGILYIFLLRRYLNVIDEFDKYNLEW